MITQCSVCERYIDTDEETEFDVDEKTGKVICDNCKEATTND